MPEFKETARGIAEEAQDIARDKLDTFQKLQKPQQILVIVAAVLVLGVAIWFFTIPETLDVVVTPIVMDGVMENQIGITNGKKPLRKIRIFLNDKYEFDIDSLDAGQTVNIGVTEFRPKGNPGGEPPPMELKPRNIFIEAKGGKYAEDFFKK